MGTNRLFAVEAILRILLIPVSVWVSAPALAQSPPVLLAEEGETSEARTAAPVPQEIPVTESLAVSLRSLLADPAHDLPAGNSVRVVSASLLGKAETFVFLYKIGWVELALPVTSAVPLATADARHAFLESKVLWALLSGKILPREEVDRRLKLGCHPRLEADLRPPRPPFYNNATGIRWHQNTATLFLEASAVIEESANQCVLGVIDLINGDLRCSRVACAVD